MDNIKLGFAMCGSFCTLSDAISELEKLCGSGWEITPIMSHNTRTFDTRFGKAQDFADRVESACGRKIIHTIPDAEPIGPKKLLDALIIAPCTGNTIAKLAITPNKAAAKVVAKVLGAVL